MGLKRTDEFCKNAAGIALTSGLRTSTWGGTKAGQVQLEGVIVNRPLRELVATSRYGDRQDFRSPSTTGYGRDRQPLWGEAGLLSQCGSSPPPHCSQLPPRHRLLRIFPAPLRARSSTGSPKALRIAHRGTLMSRRAVVAKIHSLRSGVKPRASSAAWRKNARLIGPPG